MSTALLSTILVLVTMTVASEVVSMENPALIDDMYDQSNEDDISTFPDKNVDYPALNDEMYDQLNEEGIAIHPDENVDVQDILNELNTSLSQW